MSKKFKPGRASNSAATIVSGALQASFQSYEQGDISGARAHALRALELEPRNGDANHILGICAYRSGDYAKAVEYYRSALRAVKSHFIYNNLGVALKESGRIDEAIGALRQALALKPDYAEAYCNLGNALRERGDMDGAVAAYRRSLEIKPSDPGTLNNLGNALKDKGSAEEAVEAYMRAIQLRPGFPDTYRNLGIALKQLGRLDGAIDAYRQALALKPDYAETHYSLGNVLHEKGNAAEALSAYRQALALKPDYAEAYCNLGNVLKERGEIDGAVTAYRQAILWKPDFGQAYNNLGNALKDQGKVTEALAAYEEATRVNPDLVEAHQNLIYTRQFLPGITLEKILEDHRHWDATRGLPLRSFERPFGNVRDPDRPLTLGFVSGDFRSHPVAYFLISIFEALVREDCRIICYANQKVSDGLTERFKAASHGWRNISALSDEEAHTMILGDGVDILFDLTGFIENNRLPLFARKPAPLQITWAGYMATTGMSAMDYLIADAREIPDGAERFYAEKIIRMPHSFVCYDPPAYAPPVSPLPAESHGYVTFGCFNLLCKISEPVIDLWAEVFARLPRSRLVLKTKELSCGSTGERYLSLFGERGMDPGRIDLMGRTTHQKHLRSYGDVDIALDTFPFSGSTTTLESLWMGVPVITLPHETFAGRHSLSFVSTVGLTETIASDPSRYVEIALNMAQDIPGLARLRGSLRDRFAASPLCDGAGFARHLMKELRVVWSEWCRT